MISLFRARYSTVLSRISAVVTKIEFYPPGESRLLHSGYRTVNSGLLLTRSQVQCYSSKKSGRVSSILGQKKTDPQPIVKDNKQAFFVVRKGDVVGVYKRLSDCQAQAGTSICDSPISIYEGCSMPKNAEMHLLSCGIKNAIYTIQASDFNIDLFGTLVACPLQEPPSSSDEVPGEPVTEKSKEALSYGQSCILEFYGASRGSPRRGGAGAILRSDDGTLICRLRQGLGRATKKVSEYRSFILGMKYALEKGFTIVRARGDSYCMKGQFEKQYISILYHEAKELRDRFSSFQIMHVSWGANSEARNQGNLGCKLAKGEIQEDINHFRGMEPPSSSDEVPSGPIIEKKSKEALPYGQSCILEFVGASKGNPGLAGAGVVLRSDDGTLICRLRQGLGKATKYVADYHGFILGMKYALEEGFTIVHARGDSDLVCMQVQGKWKVKKPHISILFSEAKKLMNRFTSVQITQVIRCTNTEALRQANLATKLAEGEIQEDTNQLLWRP